MPLITLKNKPKAKSAAKSSTKTSAAKKSPARKPASPAKRTTAKTPAKKAATTKKTTTKAAPKAEPQRRGLANVDPKVLKEQEAKLRAAGERLVAAQEEHDAASADIHSVAAEARENDIPMGIVTDLLGVSRQYLYKGLVGNGPNGRKNGGTPAKKTTTKTPAKKKATTTRKAASAPKPRVAKKGNILGKKR